VTAAGFKQVLSDTCSGIAGCIDQLKSEKKASEEKRKQLEKEKQAQALRLFYQNPALLTLEPCQAEAVYNELYNCPWKGTTAIYLTPQQQNDVANFVIQQAIINKNIKVLRQLRNMLICGGLEFNLSYLRYLHKYLFDDFISTYDPSLLYAACTPPGGLFFIISSDGFGFCYNISLAKEMTLTRYREDFKRYMSTASAKELFARFGLRYRGIRFFRDTKSIIIYFK